MSLKKPLRILVIVFTIVLGLLILFIMIGIAPANDSINYQNLLNTMEGRIDAIDEKPVSSEQGFRVGFGKVNLTPSHPVAFGGYGKRLGRHYNAVHDSIYARSMVIDNGIRRVAIVSADLLIIPPAVTALLEKQLPDIDFTLENTYLGASHTHNSIGSWARGVASIWYGSYDDSIVHFIADKIKASIEMATKNLLPATIKMDSVSMPEGVYNRVIDNGPVDPLLRFLEIQRNDSSKLLFISYTAHATCLFSKDMVLSGDYPGKLLEIMESRGYAFAMFMAGAVGSHGPAAPEPSWSCVDWMAEGIAEKIQANPQGLREIKNTTIEMHRVPLELSRPQPKVLHYLRLRPWLFEAAFGEYPTFISALRIGDIVFLSTPCDFSGEFNFALDSLARTENVFPIVTSFNGGYIGYLTPEKYYDVDHYETQLMSWYGPGNGEYVKQSLEKLLRSVSE
jgi:neutral ceramidase